MTAPNYYHLLSLTSSASHEEIKRAFRRKALEFHPDRNPDLEEAEERFKQIAAAYETLSDVHQRAYYDLNILAIRPISFDRGLTTEDLLHAAAHSILDSLTDDTLEELVVGNTPPPDTHFGSLFRDLERTENFILIRDGKEAYFTRHYVRAAAIFETAEQRNPQNILILFYLGKSWAALGKLKEAEKQFLQAIRVGESRNPPNRCPGVRRALLEVLQRNGKKRRARKLVEETRALNSRPDDEAEAEIARLNRAMIQLEVERLARSSKPPPKQLNA